MKTNKPEETIANFVSGRIPSVVEFSKLYFTKDFKMSDAHRRLIQSVVEDYYVLDQEKLEKALAERSEKTHALAKEYKEGGESQMAEGFSLKAFVYDEILADIKKGKFNIKQKKNL